MRRLLALLAPLMGLAALAGCAKQNNTLRPDLPPETTVFIQDTVTTAQNHRIHVYWFGSDPDGDVVGFEVRVLNPEAPADTQWVRLECGQGRNCNDSLLTIYTPNGTTAPTFEVRAIDNKEQRDPTPARLVLTTVTNQPATVTFTGGPSSTDSTFASVTVDWIASDPDGDGTKIHYRLWLDGSPDTLVTMAKTITVPSAAFLQNGTYASGPRTLSIEAIDDGGRVGPATTMTWYVLAPAPVLTNNKGRLLILDESASLATNNFTVDTLYANVATRGDATLLPAGTFRIIRPEFSHAFRSATDMLQTFHQFDAVIWYRGYDAFPSTMLQTWQDSLPLYFRNGGHLMLEGMYLFDGQAAYGWIHEDFVRQWLDCNGLYLYQDSTVALGNNSGNLRSSTFSGYPFTPGGPSRLTVLPVSQGSPGLRGFDVRDTSEVALWGMPGLLTPPTNTSDVPLGMVVNQPGGGRLIVVPFPIRALAPVSGFDGSYKVLPRILFDPTKGLLAP